nr:hypothetical protein [Elizabethkingia bruuniana]
MKTIVVSAINLNVGGTLTILRDCLSFLSEFSIEKNYRVIAIVHKKNWQTFPILNILKINGPKKDG